MNDTTHTDRRQAAPSQAAPSQANDGANSPAANQGATAGDRGDLLPYAAPAIIFRTPLEAVAASCYSAPGKADLISCLVGNS